MGEVVDFRTKAKLATTPVPDSQATGGKAPDPAVGPSLAGCLVLACPCGSTNMELWMHGVIVCCRCQRVCGSAVWNYSNRQAPDGAERTAMPDGPLPSST